jgi:hypothetical protein
VKHAVPEKIKAGSPIPLPFDQLEARNLSLGLPLAPGLRQSCLNRSFVLIHASDKWLQIGQRTFLNGL